MRLGGFTNPSYKVRVGYGGRWYAAVPVDNSGGPVAATIVVTITNNGAVVSSESFTRLVPAASASPTYDPRGNMTSDGVYVYTWDVEDRLASVQVVDSIRDDGSVPASAKVRLEFKYDEQGRRVEKVVQHRISGVWTTVSTIRFVWGGWHLLAELNGSNQLVRSYVWGPGPGGVGGLMEVRHHNPATHAVTARYQPVYDHNANVIAYVDATTHAMVASFDHTPFGRLRFVDGPNASHAAPTLVSPFLFSTKYYDHEVALYYYGYRYYNPTSGTWLNRDPLAEEGGLNLYQFCLGDPINGIDPLGEAVVLFGGGFNFPVPGGGEFGGTGPLFTPAGFWWMQIIASKGHLLNSAGKKEAAKVFGYDASLDEVNRWVKSLPAEQRKEIRIVGYSSGCSRALALAHDIEKNAGRYGTTKDSLKHLLFFDFNWGAVAHPSYNRMLRGRDPRIEPKHLYKPNIKGLKVDHVVSMGSMVTAAIPGVDPKIEGAAVLSKTSGRIIWEGLKQLAYSSTGMIGSVARTADNLAGDTVRLELWPMLGWTRYVWGEIGRKEPSMLQYAYFNARLGNTSGVLTAKQMEQPWLEATGDVCGTHYQLGTLYLCTPFGTMERLGLHAADEEFPLWQYFARRKIPGILWLGSPVAKPTK